VLVFNSIIHRIRGVVNRGEVGSIMEVDMDSSSGALLGLGALVSVLGACVLGDVIHMATTKDIAFEEAIRLSRGRGIINLGAGPHRTSQSQLLAWSPEVQANIDVALDGLPHFLLLDIEREALPFADKQFGCAFASHVLEHLDNWQFALAEASRVADFVVVVLPHPQYFSGWLSPEHRQFFTMDEIAELAQLYPNVVVYY